MYFCGLMGVRRRPVAIIAVDVRLPANEVEVNFYL